MKFILPLLFASAVASSQFVAKKGFDQETRSPFVTVNVAAAAKFNNTDAIVADKPVYLSITSSRYKAEGVEYSTYTANFRFDNLPDGTCLKTYDGKLTLVFEDGIEAPLSQTSPTDCGEHANIYIGGYSVFQMDVDQLKQSNLKKIILSTEKGPLEFSIKPDKAKTIKSSVVLLDATK